MKCDLCGKPDPRIIVLLQLPQPGGKLDTMACMDCAKKSPAFCIKHDRPHMGFIDGTTACLCCISEMAKKHASNASGMMHQIEGAISEREHEELAERLDLIMTLSNVSEHDALMHLVCTKALRSGKSITQIVGDIVAESSVASILYL